MTTREPGELLTGDALVDQLKEDAELRAQDAIERQAKWEHAQARGLEFFATTAQNVMARMIGLEGLVTNQTREIERLSRRLEEQDLLLYERRLAESKADHAERELLKLRGSVARMKAKRR